MNFFSQSPPSTIAPPTSRRLRNPSASQIPPFAPINAGHRGRCSQETIRKLNAPMPHLVGLMWLAFEFLVGSGIFSIICQELRNYACPELFFRMLLQKGLIYWILLLLEFWHFVMGYLCLGLGKLRF